MTSVADNLIAYQGEPGAYSHLACKNAYPDMQPLPCESFEEAFAAVADGRARLAMIPIENTLGGRVAEPHVLVPQSNLFIVNEHYQPVSHCLLALPQARMEGITHVSSHPQALAQCRRLIRQLSLIAVASADTAGAARCLAETSDCSRAAIASTLAGEIYGLQSLRTEVEDESSNTTRFIVLSRDELRPAVDEDCMTSLLFQVRSVPAALYKALGGFATANVNITKLESYITDERFSVAQFYVEFEGHPDEPRVMTAMSELGYYCVESNILGTYPANEFRRRQ